MGLAAGGRRGRGRRHRRAAAGAGRARGGPYASAATASGDKPSSGDEPARTPLRATGRADASLRRRSATAARTRCGSWARPYWPRLHVLGAARALRTAAERPRRAGREPVKRLPGGDGRDRHRPLHRLRQLRLGLETSSRKLVLNYRDGDQTRTITVPLRNDPRHRAGEVFDGRAQLVASTRASARRPSRRARLRGGSVRHRRRAAQHAEEARISSGCPRGPESFPSPRRRRRERGGARG